MKRQQYQQTESTDQLNGSRIDSPQPVIPEMPSSQLFPAKPDEQSTWTNWTVALFLVAMHPVLLHLLYPIIGEAANIFVFIAPVVGTILLGWRLGHLFIGINVLTTAFVFRYIAGGSADDRPKAFLVFFVLSVMCLGADRMKRYIVQRKTLAAELAQAKKLEAIGILAGGVAHDMNNTLNAILSSAYALKEEPEFRGKEFRDIDTIIAACDRGAQLTQNLLGFARKSNYRQQVFSVTNVVNDVLSILERTANKGIQIKVSHAMIPPLIQGDKAQIENAIMNLCLNALDAMSDKGRLTISTSSNSSEVTISVSDTGTGMDRTVQDRIFEPFYTTKPEGKGTGLGLSMVYGVVHSMKGRIAINTAPGQGTTFTLTFPAAPADTAQFSPEKPAPQAQRPANILEGRTVLLIDDEPLVLRAGERMLKSIGCKVLGAASGKAGIEKFKGNHPQIAMVVLDLIMPDLDGITTLESLRQIDNTTPVVLVSGYTRESEKMTSLKELGDNVRFLSKPYRPTQIIAIAQELLNDFNG